MHTEISPRQLIIGQWRHMASKIYLKIDSEKGLLPDVNKPEPVAFRT